MTLTELCEPFFLDVGELTRSTEYGGEGDASSVRRRLVDRLDQLRRTAAEQDVASLKEDYERIRPVLAFFADDVINNSTLPFAAEWSGNLLLASLPDINVVNGRVRFFLELNATLHEPPAAASQRLAIFQTCLGLGFAGADPATGTPQSAEALRHAASDILSRLDTNTASKKLDEVICGDAYDTDDRVLSRPIREPVTLIGVMCVALFVAAVAVYLLVFYWGRSEINDVLGKILPES
jgi:type IV/VI secretion system ImpK/VasF family protein